MNTTGGAYFYAKQIAASDGPTCAVDLEYRLWCWGAFSGNTSLVPQLSKHQNGSIASNVGEISVGNVARCIIDKFGRVFCASTIALLLGQGNTTSASGGYLSDSPTRLVHNRTAKKISIGYDAVCVIDNVNQVQWYFFFLICLLVVLLIKIAGEKQDLGVKGAYPRVLLVTIFSPRRFATMKPP